MVVNINQQENKVVILKTKNGFVRKKVCFTSLRELFQKNGLTPPPNRKYKTFDLYRWMVRCFRQAIGDVQMMENLDAVTRKIGCDIMAIDVFGGDVFIQIR